METVWDEIGSSEGEVGLSKVQAVQGRLCAIDSGVQVQAHVAEYEPKQIASESAVFA